MLASARRIPVGRVATYGDVAAMAGRPRAWRAVGTIMRTCTDRTVPCHRVIASGGHLGGYGGSEALKRGLLLAEGIIVLNGRIRRFREIRYGPAAARGPADPKTPKHRLPKPGRKGRAKAGQRD